MSVTRYGVSQQEIEVRIAGTTDNHFEWEPEGSQQSDDSYEEGTMVNSGATNVGAYIKVGLVILVVGAQIAVVGLLIAAAIKYLKNK